MQIHFGENKGTCGGQPLRERKFESGLRNKDGEMSPFASAQFEGKRQFGNGKSRNFRVVGFDRFQFSAGGVKTCLTGRCRCFRQGIFKNGVKPFCLQFLGRRKDFFSYARQYPAVVLMRFIGAPEKGPQGVESDEAFNGETVFILMLDKKEAGGIFVLGIRLLGTERDGETFGEEGKVKGLSGFRFVTGPYAPQSRG